MIVSYICRTKYLLATKNGNGLFINSFDVCCSLHFPLCNWMRSTRCRPDCCCGRMPSASCCWCIRISVISMASLRGVVRLVVWAVYWFSSLSRSSISSVVSTSGDRFSRFAVFPVIRLGNRIVCSMSESDIWSAWLLGDPVVCFHHFPAFFLAKLIVPGFGWVWTFICRMFNFRVPGNSGWCLVRGIDWEWPGSCLLCGQILVRYLCWRVLVQLV